MRVMDNAPRLSVLSCARAHHLRPASDLTSMQPNSTAINLNRDPNKDLNKDLNNECECGDEDGDQDQIGRLGGWDRMGVMWSTGILSSGGSGSEVEVEVGRLEGQGHGHGQGQEQGWPEHGQGQGWPEQGQGHGQGQGSGQPSPVPAGAVRGVEKVDIGKNRSSCSFKSFKSFKSKVWASEGWELLPGYVMGSLRREGNEPALPSEITYC